METLEDARYTTLFKWGHVFIHSENEGLDNMILFGERRGRVYILLGQHMSGEFGWLSDSRSMSESEEEREVLQTEVVPSNQSSVQGSRREVAYSSNRKRVNWYKMALMDKQGLEQRQPEQIPKRVAEPASVIEGASTDDPGGGTGRTSLIKREC